MLHANFSSAQAMRQFIRHPADIPIEVRVRGQLTRGTHNTFNLSIGGLAFRYNREFEPGDVVEIRIPIVHPPSRRRRVWLGARWARAALNSGLSSWLRMIFFWRVWWSKCAISRITRKRSTGQRGVSYRQKRLRWSGSTSMLPDFLALRVRIFQLNNTHNFT